MSGKKAKLLRRAARAFHLSVERAEELRRAHGAAASDVRGEIARALERGIKTARVMASPLAIPRPTGRLIATPAEAARERAGQLDGLIRV